jgi:hypothetical protein
MLLFCFNSFLFYSFDRTRYPIFGRLVDKILESERHTSKDPQTFQNDIELVAKSEFIAVAFVKNFTRFLEIEKRINSDFNYENYTDQHKKDLANLLLHKSAWNYYEHRSELSNEERCRYQKYIMDAQGRADAIKIGGEIAKIDAAIKVIAEDEKRRFR